MGDALIRQYYTCFNERRFADAASLFVDDAILEHIPFGQIQRGAIGYFRFVESWLPAFPNAVLTLEHVEQRNATMVTDTSCDQQPYAATNYPVARRPPRQRPRSSRQEFTDRTLPRLETM